MFRGEVEYSVGRGVFCGDIVFPPPEVFGGRVFLRFHLRARLLDEANVAVREREDAFGLAQANRFLRNQSPPMPSAAAPARMNFEAVV